MLLVQPSSAAAERVFSLLENSFSKQQTRSLENYVLLVTIYQLLEIIQCTVSFLGEHVNFLSYYSEHQNPTYYSKINAIDDTLAGLQWFSTLDLRFWQVGVDWQKCTTPLGLCNPPATFQGLMVSRDYSVLSALLLMM